MKEENSSIMTAIQGKQMTVEEYIQFETTSELRHEYINGQLFELPGEKLLNLKIAAFLSAYLLTLLEEQGYIVYSTNAKVAIPNENKYYYPDLVVTNEPEDLGNDYVVYQPELLVEIISRTSRTRDTVDKYIDYTKIPSLKYYFVIDPERVYVTVHSKNPNGEWEAEAYNSKEEVILLPLLNLELPLNKIFR